MFFKKQIMKGDAELNPQTEFTSAFGEELAEEIFESGRYYRGNRNEKRRPPEDIRIDLIKMWDALALKYADGGVGLARSQAAKKIQRGWPLQERPFEVVNGKAVIEDRVYSETSFGCKTRHLSYSCRSSIFELLKAVNVFLEFADLEGNAVQSFFNSDEARGDQEITSGRRYVVAKGHVEFRTFYESWRWTPSESAANKLREFIGEYGDIRGES